MGTHMYTHVFNNAFEQARGALNGKNAPAIEQAILGMVHLSTLTTSFQVVTYLTSVISVYCDGELARYALAALSKLFAVQIAEQAGDEHPCHDGFSAFCDGLRIVKSSELVKRLRRVLTMCFFGVLGKEKATVAKDSGVWKRLLHDKEVTSYDALDMMEEIVSAVRVAWDISLECIAARSFGPLLGREVNIVQLESEFAFVKAHMPYYLNGTLERITDTSGLRVTEEEFVGRVRELDQRLSQVHRLTRNPSERLIVTRMLASARTWQCQVNEFVSQEVTRLEPFSIKLDGSTGVGKTSMAAKIVRDVLKIAGKPHGDKNIAFMDPCANFADTVFNHTTGIIMDDVSNIKPIFAKTEELINIIQIGNTAKTPVNKADLSDKGTVFYNPSVFLISTNVPKLHALEKSEEPSAILRRFPYHILVEPAPGYGTSVRIPNFGDTLNMLDPSKITGAPGEFVQMFTVKRWVPRAREQGQANADTGELLNYEGAVGLNYSQLMQFLHPRIVAHYASQRRYRATMKEDQDAPLCAHGWTTSSHCHLCQQPGLQEQAGPGLAQLVRGISRLRGLRPAVPQPDLCVDCGRPLDGRPVCIYCHPAEEVAAPVVVQERVRELDEEPEVVVFRPRRASLREQLVMAKCWVSRRLDEAQFADAVVPPSFVQMLQIVTGGAWDMERAFMRNPTLFFTAIFFVAPAMVGLATQLLFSVSGLGGVVSATTSFGVACGTALRASTAAVAWVKSRIAGRTLPEIQRQMKELAQEHFGRVLCAIVGALVVCVAAKRLLGRSARSPPQGGGDAFPTGAVCRTCQHSMEPGFDFAPQGGAESALADDVFAVPDPRVRENVWERRKLVTAFDPGGTVRTMTHEQIVARVMRQLYVVVFSYASGKFTTTYGLMVATNLALFPAHNVYRQDGTMSPITEVTFRRTSGECGPIFKCRIDATTVVRLAGDMVLCHTGTGGTQHDLRELLPTALPDAGVRLPLKEYRRSFITHEIEECGFLSTVERQTSRQYGWEYLAYVHLRPEPTFHGLCGAVLMSQQRYPSIVALHTMGDGHHAIACCLLRSDVDAAFERLRCTGTHRGPVIEKVSTVLHTPPGLDARAEIAPLAENSVLREAPDAAPFEAIGTLANYSQVRARSNLQESSISAFVAEVCGEPRKHGPPCNINKATVEKAKIGQLGAAQMPPKIMLLAQIDLKDEWKVVAGVVRPYFKPLTERESCSGIIGSSSVRRVRMSTAAGFPLNGDKEQCVMRDPTPNAPDSLILRPEVRAEIEELRCKMRKLHRVNWVFKGSHKDEPTKFTKLKVRVFEGTPFTMLFLLRQYFAPVMRIFATFPLETESAVGINANGMDWHKLAADLEEYGSGRVLEGDWKHFDTSLVYQEMMAVFTIWIELAQESGGYSEDDINIMWVLAEEVSRHYSVLRGDVALFEGANPSGQALTVYLNNGVNALRMRAFFYACAPDDVESIALWRPDRESLGGVTLPSDARAHLEPLRAGLSGRFRDYAHAIFYGDDALIAPHPSTQQWFTQYALAEWFAEQGKDFTSTQKGPFEEAFTPLSRASFLKRGFRMEPSVGHVVGPLEMDSIYKSLHVWPKKLVDTQEVHAAEVIAQACRELFNHGEEVFRSRAQQLAIVAELCGAAPFMDDWHFSWDQQVVRWKAAAMVEVNNFGTPLLLEV